MRSITYDGRGNTLSETRPGSVAVSTTYDGYGRLTGYTRTGQPAQANVYNGLDDRVAVTSTVSGTASTRRYIYDGDGRLMGEYGASASDVKGEFVWLQPEQSEESSFSDGDGIGGYAVVAVAVGSGATQTIQYVHTSHLGTPVLTTGASGASVTPGDYSAIGFPGQMRTLSDLYYNRYRDYDPTTGRYIQADPIGLMGGANDFAYAANNPIRFIDPKGLQLIPVPRFIPLPVPLPAPLPQLPRPPNMTPLEERQYSRYCQNASDPCAALKAAARQELSMARLKMGDMLLDNGFMYGSQGWANHAAGLEGRLNKIRAIIKVGKAMGCDMSDIESELATIFVPSKPIRLLGG